MSILPCFTSERKEYSGKGQCRAQESGVEPVAWVWARTWHRTSTLQNSLRSTAAVEESASALLIFGAGVFLVWSCLVWCETAFLSSTSRWQFIPHPSIVTASRVSDMAKCSLGKVPKSCPAGDHCPGSPSKWFDHLSHPLGLCFLTWPLTWAWAAYMQQTAVEK
jgi:hypothetical protein